MVFHQILDVHQLHHTLHPFLVLFFALKILCKFRTVRIASFLLVPVIVPSAIYPSSSIRIVSYICNKYVCLNTSCRLTISCGGVTLDEGRHAVTVNDRPVSLTLKEYELLKLFLENIGQVFSREALLSRVWDADYAGETRTVDVHVGTLRTKLSECGGLIETVRGVGYKMEGMK